MEKTHVKIYLFLILALFTNCKHVSNYRLTPSGKTITFCLSADSKTETSAIKYLNIHGKKYLILLNMDMHRLDYYDFITGKILSSTVLQKEGPNGIGNIIGFDMCSLDSIITRGAAIKGGIPLINREGEILSKFLVKNSNQQYPFCFRWPDSDINCNLFWKNDSVVVVTSIINFPILKEEDLTNCKLMAEINLKTGKSLVLDPSHPLLKNKMGWRLDTFYSFMAVDNTYYFSFTNTSDVYVYDSNMKLSIKPVESEYLKRDFNEDMSDVKRIIESPTYGSFYCDKNNKYCYRFCRHGEDVSNERDLFLNDRYPSNFSIILTDLDLNVLGETVLPIDRYVFMSSFLTEEGLYVSKSNVFSPNYDEDRLVFELFTVKKE